MFKNKLDFLRKYMDEVCDAIRELLKVVNEIIRREQKMSERINTNEQELEQLKKEVQGIADKLGLVWIPAKFETNFEDAHWEKAPIKTKKG